jgi:hypothetical protein
MECQPRLALLAVAVSLWAATPLGAQHDDIVARHAPPAAPHRFSPADEALLDAVQHGCFRYLWEQVGSPAGLAKDRLKGPVSSIAAVGFQLSSLPIGVERKLVSRADAERRCTTVLRALLERSDNKKLGVYLHFPDKDTAGLSHEGYEIVASTIDHALLMAGAMTAAAYFGGETAPLADRLIADTNWRAFAVAKDGYLSMGWRPDDITRVDGTGKFLEHHWWCASDEERLIYFLAAGAPRDEFAVDPKMYYQLKRDVRGWNDMPPFAASWPGTLFTYFFSHCWIDYGRWEPDDPKAFGIDAPRVDWFENSRRAVLTHRQRCVELASQYGTLAADRWGLSACTAREGYIVPHLRPNLADRDEPHGGTVAPYAAASAIMFTPHESMAALRAFMALRDESGAPLAWRDTKQGGFGFVDSFNLDQKYASDDIVGIDVGPMLLAIENARTGLVWRLFSSHPTAKLAAERLRWAQRIRSPKP